QTPLGHIEVSAFRIERANHRVTRNARPAITLRSIKGDHRMERTLIIFKPDAVQRGLCGEILTRFEKKGIQIVGMKAMKIPASLAETHYGPHKGKPFYEGLVKF